MGLDTRSHVDSHIETRSTNFDPLTPYYQTRIDTDLEGQRSIQTQGPLPCGVPSLRLWEEVGSDRTPGPLGGTPPRYPRPSPRAGTGGKGLVRGPAAAFLYSLKDPLRS